MLNFKEILELNQQSRDIWVKKSISKFFLSNSSVLDIGAGTGPYKDFLKEYKYIAHDFGEYEGIKLGGTHEYNEINIKSDILDIPLESGSIDNIICTEVLEHIPKPIDAVNEIARLLKPGGHAIITTPFTSGSHQEPFHFYSGFSRFFYDYVAKNNSLEIIEFQQNGGYFRFMAQEISRLAGYYEILKTNEEIDFLNNLPENMLAVVNDLLKLDEKYLIKEFSVGFHLVFQKSF
jgi:SAM-dependent methyltransferase